MCYVIIILYETILTQTLRCVGVLTKQFSIFEVVAIGNQDESLNVSVDETTQSLAVRHGCGRQLTSDRLNRT